jgi:hypothetical protein
VPGSVKSASKQKFFEEKRNYQVVYEAPLLPT